MPSFSFEKVAEVKAPNINLPSVTPAEKRKRGRPRTRDAQPTLDIKYPVQWKPIYDQFIYEHLNGISHREIAKKYDFHEVQVGNVIRCPQAQARIEDIRGRLNSSQFSSLANIDDRIKGIKEQVVKRVAEFVENDTLAQSSPFAFLSTATRALASVSGESGKKSGDTTNNNISLNNSRNILISVESTKNITEALEMSKDIGLLVSNG